VISKSAIMQDGLLGYRELALAMYHVPGAHCVAAVGGSDEEISRP
jgi:hypothetical protein